LPTDEQKLQELHQRIGNVIWSLSNDWQREWYVLAAAKQHNKALGLVKDREERTHLQNVNVKAAKIARTRYAYGPAAEFLEAAITLMDSKHEWDEQYQVMLTIHSMAAEMCMAAGRFEDCKRHATLFSTMRRHLSIRCQRVLS
jgi:predicted ATPase